MTALKKTTAALVLALLASSMAFAAESKSPVKSGVTIEISTNNHNHYDDDDDLDDLIDDIFELLWLYDNLMINFDYYPYYDGQYIKFTGLSVDSYGNFYSYDEYDSFYNTGTPAFMGKPYRFEADTNLTWYPAAGIIANESRFEGYFWKFFGPVFENSLYSSLSNIEPLSGNLKLGGQFSMIHSNIFDWSFYMQWTHWYGHNKGNGINFGTIMRSYPFDPLLIEWRGCFQDLNLRSDGDGFIYESTLEVGFMTGSPVEVYGAWKLMGDSFFTNTVSDGISCGVKFHF